MGEAKLPEPSDISNINWLVGFKEPAGLKEKLTSKVLNPGLAHSWVKPIAGLFIAT
jgi:hypothetical protein